jgi:succinate dehydrogenase/fumarate reductase flavoprotein subunit
MWEKVAVFRTEAGLKSALRDLEQLRNDLEHQALRLKSRHFNQELAEGLENYCLVKVAQCVTEAALRRRESRGAHYRHDYPETDNRNWLKHVVIRESGRKLVFDSTPTDLSEIRPEGSF